MSVSNDLSLRHGEQEVCACDSASDERRSRQGQRKEQSKPNCSRRNLRTVRYELRRPIAELPLPYTRRTVHRSSRAHKECARVYQGSSACHAECLTWAGFRGRRKVWLRDLHQLEPVCQPNHSPIEHSHILRVAITRSRQTPTRWLKEITSP